MRATSLAASRALPALALALMIAALLMISLAGVVRDKHLPAFLTGYDPSLVGNKNRELIVGGPYQ
jgi:hypothetical protein